MVAQSLLVRECKPLGSPHSAFCMGFRPAFFRVACPVFVCVINTEQSKYGKYLRHNQITRGG